MEAGLPLYDTPSGDVCADCFSDYAIRRFIHENSYTDACTYCGAQSEEPIASSLEDVVGFINDGLLREYEMIDDGGVPYDPEERDYMYHERYDTNDVVGDELDLPRDRSGDLAQAIAEGLGIERVWVPKEPMAMREDDWLIQSWDSFSRHVKHENRFFFREQPQDCDRRDLIHPSRMLEALAVACEKCDMYRQITDETIYRVRFEPEGSTWSEATDLGPTPTCRAVTDNRMSPVGIVMFYGAFDPETAIAETVTPPCRVAIGRFRLRTEMTVLDLTNFPKVSIFDPENGRNFRALEFLKSFSRAISQRVNKDRQVHVEYVPTQVVTEYFRHVEGSVMGILYPSAVRPGHSSLVLFADQNSVLGCHDADGLRDVEPWIEFVGVDHRDLA